MGYRVCKLTEAGVSVTTPVPDDWATASTLAATDGGEVVSAGLLAALTSPPPRPAGVTIGDFKLAVAPALLAVAAKDAATQAKWDRVLNLLLSSPADRVVYPAEQPLAGLLRLAVADGILTADQVAAVGAGG